MFILLCPKCKNELKIIRYTDWDNLETYLYPRCEKCNWTTYSTFTSEKQLKAYFDFFYGELKNEMV